jgi:hypothetical protein
MPNAYIASRQLSRRSRGAADDFGQWHQAQAELDRERGTVSWAERVRPELPTVQRTRVRSIEQSDGLMNCPAMSDVGRW